MLQPFVGYTTKTFTTFMVNQMLKVGKQPIQLQLGYRYYAEGPSGGPVWGLRFTVFFFFK